MEKPAETSTPIHELLARRWSPRAFSERPVERDKLLSVLEAARWTPSSRNEQPWAYLVAPREDSANFEAMLAVLADSNRLWAQKVPVLILTLAHTRWEKEGTPNRVGIYDLGQAAANLVVQATSLGLSAHQMGGFNVEAARARFHVPDGWEPVTVVALGYGAEPDTLPEALRERELGKRSRKPLEQFVFSGAWGIPSPLLESNTSK
ncbi:MAG: nitroreductase family protein [Acidobacteriia bacterium]|nr:nitroreductase family protein [Terriglobia bacterium]